MGASQERWALVWREAPRPACGVDDVDMALTCPCTGFAYGEAGVLDLVRGRSGRPDERLPLTHLYHDAGQDGPNEIDTFAVVQRWPVRESDLAATVPGGFVPAIRERPVTRVMAFGDYDHDGRATEFLLQVGTLPCGKRQAVLVGVSSSDSSLHIFSSVSHPDRALVLPIHLWDLLRRSPGPATGLEWRCGDHGSETETEVSLRAGPAGVDGTRAEYACTSSGARGRLLSSTGV